MQLEERVFKESLETIEDLLAFGDVDPETGAMPKGWVEKYGQVRAERKLRIARAAWLPAKTAPIALAQAVKLNVGIQTVRSRTRETSGDVVVNVGIAMPVPSLVRPRKVVEGE